MSANVITTVAARFDLDRIFMYLIEQGLPEVASRFNDAFEETLAFISDFPDLGAPLESAQKRLANVRVKPIHGFENHLAFYRVQADRVYVLRILHGHQQIEKIL